MVINNLSKVDELLAHRETMRLARHALFKGHKESLRATDILHAVFNGHILEHYPQRRRVLIAGPSARFDLQLNVVCDYADRDAILAVTVYIPDRPRWASDSTRA